MSTQSSPTTTGAARTYNGRTCAIVNCRRSQGKDGKDGVRFLKFPKNRNREQHRLWVKAVNRQNLDGSLWEPGAHDMVCSDHFVNGKKRVYPAGISRTNTWFQRY